MTSRLRIDIETYSSVDLKRFGVYRYAASPDFMILMASWSLDGSPVETALSYDEIAAIPGLWDPEVVKVAHNAQFERVCFSRFNRDRVGVWAPDGYLPPGEWHDTAAVAAQLGYPRSLDGAAKALECTPKDSAGTRLINIFCKPNRKGERTLPADKPMEWLDFIAYCEQDVETLAEVDEALEAKGGWHTEMERAVYLADQRINDFGIAIDVPLAKAARTAALVNQESQVKRIQDLTAETGHAVDNPGSVPQMTKWMSHAGLKLPNLRAETVEGALRGDLDPEVREVLELRLELALAASKKYGTALGGQINGRLHGTLLYHGAHTGRWAGRGTQIQNLPRAAFDTEDEQQAAILDLLLGLGGDALTLKKLVRPLFKGPFTVVDYSAIEARVISWLANETWALEAFRHGRDIYVETAERMGGLTRAQGKIAVLALGYNGGANSLKAMASHKDIIEVDGEPRLLADVDDDTLYDMFVYPWRDANARIVKLWKILEMRFRSGGDVGPHMTFEKQGRDRLLRLPSGRAICYRGCGVAKYRDPVSGKERERLYFQSSAGYRADTYGGRLAENATQAVARDIMAEALVRLHDHGFNVVGHVHDEILVEGEHDVDLISKIMTEVPSWATDMPIDGEGFTTDRYRKG